MPASRTHHFQQQLVVRECISVSVPSATCAARMPSIPMDGMGAVQIGIQSCELPTFPHLTKHVTVVAIGWSKLM